MSGLLVSVRSVTEALTALQGGADIIDVKEPNHGSLGAADCLTWNKIAEAMPAAVILSAACGEFIETACQERVKELPQAYRYYKIGLAGARGTNWRAQLQNLWRHATQSIRPIAVAYVDNDRAKSPPIEEVLDFALESDAAGLLCDTFDKGNGGLMEHLQLPKLKNLIDLSHQHHKLCVIAGSLSFETIRSLIDLGAHPDYFAVRGATCADGRTGTVCRDRVRMLSTLLHGDALTSPHPSITNA